MNIKKSITLAVMTALSTIPWQSTANDVWQQSISYTAGSEVCFASTLYKARWWANPGEEPGSSQWGAWVAKADSTVCDNTVSPPVDPVDPPVEPIDPPVEPIDPPIQPPAEPPVTPPSGDPYETGVTKNPAGGYFINPALVANTELEKTSSPLFSKVKNTIRKLDNASVESVTPLRAANPRNVKRLEAILDQASFEFLFAQRAPEYTYRKFLQAVAKFPAFCDDYDSEQQAEAVCRKALATMFAHFTQETGGHDPHSAIPQWRQGLYFIREAGCSETSAGCGYNNSCGPSTWQGQTWPCGTDEQGLYLKYFGRGAKQLSYNYNYGPFSDAMFGDVNVLLNNPELVADTWLNLASAVFFFVYPQPPKPDMMSVVDGSWVPNEADIARGISPGFGATINIINGGIECGHGYDKPQALNRIAYYEQFAAYLNVPIDNNEVLNCSNQDSFTNDGSGALNIHWSEDWSWQQYRPDGKSFECKLVPYQTPYFALSEGAYKRCVEEKFNATVE